MKRILQYIFLFIIVLALGSCASSGNTQKSVKKKKAKRTMMESSHLGKNKFYFSKEYQKKLTKSTKKNRRQKRR